jgi:subtilisin family serine protease
MRAAWVLWCVALLLGSVHTALRAASLAVSAAEEFVIVAIDDTAETAPSPGSTPRARYGSTGYAGSTRAEAVAHALAQQHRLQEHSSWRIAPLQWRCMLYRLPAGVDRVAALARLSADARVQLAQPLNQFNTLASLSPGVTGPAAPATAATTSSTAALAYDDPYVGLQRGFINIQAAGAQRWSQGEGVRVALIDSGVDVDHPDLAGRIGRQRDVVGAPTTPAAPGDDRHGTEMAGVIAAVANNQKGIVGVAPQARLWVYRACWAVTKGGSACNSFTLAKALGVAIADGVDIINLSLGGPADPLLQRLVEYSISRGTIVVGASPAGTGAVAGPPGFPAGVPGVLSVASADDGHHGGTAPGLHRTLTAPGRDILTLAPGGGYGYASGASLAAAHVSGAVAVLRALQPGLDANTVHRWLSESSAAPVAGAAHINLCHAVRRLRPAAVCASASASTDSSALHPSAR